MSTYDQMIVDNRYPGDFDDDKYLFSSQSNAQQDLSNKDEDGTGLLGRRVYLESPSLDNKEEEDMYRYVSSRLTNRTGSIIDTKAPVGTGAALMDSLDFELDILGTNNTHSQIPYRKESISIKPQGQSSNTLNNIPRADPRQDPLLGPLLAELDAMSNQQQQQQIPLLPPTPPPIYRRNSVPYQPNLVRPTGSSQSNHVLTNIANRTVTDALFEAELYDSLDLKDQQQQYQTNPYSASNINLPNYSQTQQQQQQQQQQYQINPYSASNINLPNYSQTQQQQQYQTNPYSASNINLPNYSQSQQQSSHLSKMDNNDIFMPSSYTTDPGAFLSYFGQEDQLFHRPLLNSLGQNYVPNHRPSLPLPPPPPPPQQYDTTFDQTHTHMPSTQRTSYVRPNLPPNPINTQPSSLHSVPSNQQNTNVFNEYQRIPPQQHYEEQIPRQINPPNNQEIFFTDNKDDQYEQQQQQQQSFTVSHRSNDQQDQDSKRQAIWTEFQRTSAKTQGKNGKKRESPNRGKGTFGSSSTWNSSGSQQSATLFKPPQRILHHPPPMTKSNNIEEHIDMIKNKENFYQRSPVRKYENLYLERKDLHNDYGNGKHEQEPKIQSPSSTKPQRQSSLPVTINLNTGENSQNGSIPATVTIPLDGQINNDGDKISLNIDLRLLDLQNLKQQQQQQQQHQHQQQHQSTSDHPHWSNLYPLDRHIRKLERSIDETLPATHPPQRSPIIPSTVVNPSMGRYGKTTTGMNRSGYNPPVYGGDYNYSDKGREEDSYLSKLNQTRKNAQFKPYTGHDYEQFKKNYGFGTGHLGYDFDNTTHKEKLDKMVKTRQYAQQIEARNKKKLADVSRRTLSDTRLRPEASKPSRSSAYALNSIRPKQYSGISTHSSPPTMNGILPYIPARRPTEVLYRPPPAQRQLIRLPEYENNEIDEHLNIHQKEENVSRKPTMSPSQKKEREHSVENDNRRNKVIERVEPSARINQRHSSLPKNLPPIRLTNSDNKRRPIKFDKALLLDEPTYSSPRKNDSIQEQQSNVDQLTNQHNDKKIVMEVIRQELSERPLNENEEIVVVEQKNDT
ncbi:unnamed protein product [Rotaria sp. Silwood2]|nr:unnamed protein product [Rotaria sp. Silwood2]CAF2720597.1 unnamed protein product [Rotaria sp. Silwood2]CAF3142650.1 unnamed protein product [Rotaria sp. Silwood2]CAF3879036.1 unnamed protein product [Rotaria sp. Silwood2]CAF3976696.1 unnamed protein product [Rotaria sp. Silwood2]